MRAAIINDCFVDDAAEPATSISVTLLAKTLLWVIAMLMLTGFGLPANAQQADADSSAAVAIDAAADSDPKSSAESADASAPLSGIPLRKKSDNAVKHFFDGINRQLASVDQWFGKWVVGPLAGVIFNGLWTGDYTDAEGIERPGWLGTTVPFIVIWLLVGAVFFTVRMGFINIRGFWHAIRLTRGDYDDPDDEGEVTHFQALSSALSGTVGLGNIAGVAIAIAEGGPGATFWMILVGLLGMSSKFTECTLGQMYRTTDKRGRVSGGPMRYLRKGLGEKGMLTFGTILSGVFAILCIGGSFGGGNTFQISQSLDAIKTEIPILNEYGWLYGAVMALAVGLVIVGGIKSIGKVASRIVPFMCVGYVFCAIYILAANYTEIPSAFSQIWNGAFNADAGWGAFLGCMVIGIKRAVFSNEAGTGSASIAHSAAKTDIPVREGYVALLEPFIDTVVVCTMTALVIIITGVVTNPEASVRVETLRDELATVVSSDFDLESLTPKQAEALVVLHKPEVDANKDNLITVSDMIELNRGAYFTKEAFARGGHPVFRWFLYLAVVLFAYSTCISWYYYGERCFTTLFGTWSSIVFKILFLTSTFLGSVISAGNIRDFSDMMILGMAFPNMLGMYFFSGNVRQQLRGYLDDLKSGRIEPHQPDAAGDQ